jgi:hypothetical protein
LLNALVDVGSEHQYVATAQLRDPLELGFPLCGKLVKISRGKLLQIFGVNELYLAGIGVII